MIDRLAPSIRTLAPNAGTQQWRDLLFVHWEVDANDLVKHIPHELQVDTFDGKAYLGLVPFVMKSIRPSWWPGSRGFDFLETNIRTYVTYRDHPGVYFFSLDANSWPAILAARVGWSLPYFPARMTIQKRSNEIQYQVLRQLSRFRCRIEYRIGSLLPTSQPDSLEHFLIERYYLFVKHHGRIHRGQVHHCPYPIFNVALNEFNCNLAAMYTLPKLDKPPDCAHYSTGVDVEVFKLQPV